MKGKTNACGGNKSSVYGFIQVSYPSGATCTCTKGSTVLTAPDTSGSVVFKIPESGTWRVTATLDSQTATQDVPVTTLGGSGTATLTFRVPSAYQEVNYIESTGTVAQYIDTGLVYNTYATIELEYMIRSSDGVPLGSFGGSAATWATLPQRSDGNDNFIAGGAQVIKTGSTTAKRTAVMNSSGVAYNGASVTAWSQTPQYSGSLTLFLFAANVNGTPLYYGQIRIYAFKVYSGSYYYADYVPVRRKSDGALGFWDVTSQTFKQNNGSGTFSYG